MGDQLSLGILRSRIVFLGETVPERDVFVHNWLSRFLHHFPALPLILTCQRLILSSIMDDALSKNHWNFFNFADQRLCSHHIGLGIKSILYILRLNVGRADRTIVLGSGCRPLIVPVWFAKVIDTLGEPLASQLANCFDLDLEANFMSSLTVR